MVAAAAFTGCIDPEADYDAFVQRPVVMPEAGTPDVVLTPCEQLLAQNPSGSYLVSCMPHDIQAPFGLAFQMTTTTVDGGGTTLDSSFQPLSTAAQTLTDVVGDPVTLPPTAVNSDCTFVQTIGMFTLPANANTLNSDIVVDKVLLRAKLETADSACGDLDGTVVAPPIGLMLSGDQDICVFIRTPQGAALPTVMATDYVCDPTQLPPR
jgi:hypothetical protein